jgi:hypothetical protein
MSTATFFLSTGRCGTQWLAANLQRFHGEAVRVEHEPLQTEYEPRRMLSASAQPSLAAREHVEEIRRGIETRPYVECGHPCWSSLSWIAETLAGRMRIVHLIRDPVATASSWVARGAFIPPILPHIRERVLISPFDEGVSFAGYRERWFAMLPFEKCLLYWAEVNAFALRLEERFAGPWLRLRYEDLFHADGAAKLLTFLGQPVLAGFLAARTEHEDRLRFLSESSCDPRLLDSHPEITALANCLGYGQPDSS